MKFFFTAACRVPITGQDKLGPKAKALNVAVKRSVLLEPVRAVYPSFNDQKSESFRSGSRTIGEAKLAEETCLCAAAARFDLEGKAHPTNEEDLPLSITQGNTALTVLIADFLLVSGHVYASLYECLSRNLPGQFTVPPFVFASPGTNIPPQKGENNIF